MVETSDPAKWNQQLEKVFIEILLEEAQANQEKIRDGILTKEHAQAITLLFYGRTGKDYNAEQISGKFKHIKKRYYAFSHLIGRSDKEWDSNMNRVRGSKDAWAEAVAVNSACWEFHRKELAHYGLLARLFPTVAQTSSANEQGCNPKGKQPADTETSSGKRMKTVSRAPESRLTIDSAQGRAYSMTKVTDILKFLAEKHPEDLDDVTMFRATELFASADMREAFMAYPKAKRLGLIKHLTKSP